MNIYFYPTTQDWVDTDSETEEDVAAVVARNDEEELFILTNESSVTDMKVIPKDVLTDIMNSAFN